MTLQASREIQSTQPLAASCGWELGYEHFVSILCGERAVIRFDRNEFGYLYLCRSCASLKVHQEMQKLGYGYTVLAGAA